MNKKEKQYFESKLADRLKHEAETARPEFSEELHRDIISVLRDQKSNDDLQQVSVDRSKKHVRYKGKRWFSGNVVKTFAAAVVIGVATAGFVISYLPDSPDKNRVNVKQPVKQLEGLAALAGITAHSVGIIDDFTENMFQKQQLILLQHDAEAAVDMLLENLPMRMLSNHK